MAKSVGIGLLGCGTVGQGIVKILQDKTSPLLRRLDHELVIRKILVRDLKKNRGQGIPYQLLTKDPREILQADDIDIVVEVMGGLEPAGSLLLQALEKGKHIVTANKALLAEAGEPIFLAAARNNRHVGFEASVAGGIPILKAISEGFIANRIEKVMGIINGTCNYILTTMTEHGWTFDEAVRRAQDLGFAEADPSLDIDGTDSAHKLAILTALCYGVQVQVKEIYTEGIEQVTLLDHHFAERLGYRLKLLAITQETSEGIDARVHPVMIAKDHMLANVPGAMNAIYLIGDAVGEAMFYGAGAGSLPTASAVISDIAAIVGRLDAPSVYDIAADLHIGEIRPIAARVGEYYLRFSVVDRPKVLAQIASVLGEHEISITSVYQEERRLDGPVPIVVMTHEAGEAAIQKALAEITKQESILDKPMLIRVEK